MKNRLNPLIFGMALAVLCAFGPESRAVTGNSLYAGASAYSHSLAEVTQSSSGDTAVLGPLYFPLSVQYAFSLSSPKHLYVGPMVGATPMGRTSAEGNQKSYYYLFRLPVIQNISEGRGWDWEAGPSYWLYNIEGSGGLVTLNNGGTTKQFATPGGSRSARTFGFDFGLGYNFETVRVGTAIVSEGLFSNTKRDFSLLVTVGMSVLGGSRD